MMLVKEMLNKIMVKEITIKELADKYDVSTRTIQLKIKKLGYERKQMPLSRKRTGKQETV
ncbi:HTH domain-containing protein [Priestia megaterium]|uniref:HTH domain-containing protein n=1 Tax=Priestia megaterium TaxID=1404 RepID=UPI003671DB7C